MELPRAKAVFLAVSGPLLAAAAFAAARGRGAIARGLAFGATLALMGGLASRWPQLARALELCGWTFVGPFLDALLSSALALSGAGAAAALLHLDARASAPRLLLALALLWAAPTLAVESALERWRGFGARSLAEAAGVPGNREAQRRHVLWLEEEGPSRQELLMALDTADLSRESLQRLQSFLDERRGRHVFARQALEALRKGWRQWWEAERALEAYMRRLPGRVPPDYRRALDLLKAGPLTPARHAQLESLEASAKESAAGFEDVTQSQYIFEGFSAAYARFGDEDKARQWLYRIDRLWPISDKKIEVTPVEDFREGSVQGQVLADGAPARDLRVGLFMIWKSSPTGAGLRLLSGSVVPDAEGRFLFSYLGPGRYKLALMGEPGAFDGRVLGGSPLIEIDYDRPRVFLPPIRVDRAHPADEPLPFAPPPSSALDETPVLPLEPLRLPRGR